MDQRFNLSDDAIVFVNQTQSSKVAEPEIAMQNDTVQHLEAPEMPPIHIRDETTEGEPVGTFGTEDARKLMESA
jgi:hypothetical protein